MILDPRFSAGPFEEAILNRASAAGIALAPDDAAALARHARAVLAANERMHLTTVVEPEQFLERHIGESFEGAALLGPEIAGTHVDLGSGNGYPGIPLAMALPGLKTHLIEASHKKAEFLRGTIGALGLSDRIAVIERQVQRGSDLVEVGTLRVLTIRAVGGWARLLPKLASTLDAAGLALLWGGDEVEDVRRREAWRKVELVETRKLPTMDRAMIWVFRRATR